MQTVIINTFDGGHAEDIRTFATNECESSVNFDITSNPHLIRPFSDPVAETISTGSTVMTDFQITDVLPVSISGTTKLVGWGRESAASSKATFFTKSAPITSAWAAVATAASMTPIANTLVEYKGSAYAIDSQPNLVKFTSGTTYTSIGNINAPNVVTSVYAKPFVHPEDNILYYATADYIIGKYDGSALTNNAFTLPSNLTITSLTNWGGYLAIACKPTSGVGRSYVYMWGRDTSLTTAQALVDWGDGALELLENINGVLVGVSSVKAIGTFDTIINYNYQVKTYTGGSVDVVKDFIVTNTNVLRHYKAKQNNKLYFGFDTDNAIFACGKNKSGNWFVTKDRYLTPTGSTVTGTLNGISLVGDILFAAYTDGGTAGYLMRTSDSTFAGTSIFLSTVNPNMPVASRYENKKLVSVQVAYKLNSSSGTVGLGYYCENDLGTSAGSLQTVISSSKSASGDYVVTAQANSDGTPFLTGREYQFRVTSVGDVRIKEIKYKFEVMPTI